MAASFTVLSQEPTSQVISPTQVLEVMNVGFVTHPSNVLGYRLVPREAWDAKKAGEWLEPLALAIEGLLSGGLASYASFVQDVDPASGLLSDAFQFVVTYDPGDGRPVQETVVTVPITALTADTQFGGVLSTYFGGSGSTLDPAQALRDAYDTLVATAGL